jgi:PKD repeat protein
MKTLFLIALSLLIGQTTFAQTNHDFSPNRNIISCGPNNVYFVYNKAVIPDLIKWDFGDGETSTQINPVHYYANTGVYTVKLYITKNNICDTVIKQNFITILNKPEADFEITKIPNEPFSLEIKSTSKHHADSFIYQHWIMGFDTISKSPNMNIRFTQNGKYPLLLKVANNEGCTDVKDTTIEIDFPELEPVGFEEEVTKIHQVYPNPTSGNLNLNIAAGVKITKVTMVDNNSKQIEIKPEFNGEIWTTNLSELKQGLYLMWIKTEKETYQTKVLVAQ